MVRFHHSDKTHMTLDHKGIHDRICQLLIPLRTPMEVLGTDEEREHREKQANNRRVFTTSTHSRHLIYV